MLSENAPRTRFRRSVIFRERRERAKNEAIYVERNSRHAKRQTLKKRKARGRAKSYYKIGSASGYLEQSNNLRV